MPRALKLVDPLSGKALSDFDWFWEEYPRKRSKGDAYKAWLSTATVRPDIEAIIAMIDKKLSTGEWRENESQYIPYPGTWEMQAKSYDSS